MKCDSPKNGFDLNELGQRYFAKKDQEMGLSTGYEE